MITITLMALIASAVTVSVIQIWIAQQEKQARTECLTFRHAVQAARIDGAVSPNACPTVEALIEAEILDDEQRTEDPWDQPYRIICEGRRIIVTSDGRDGVPGTEDDLTSRHERRDD